MHLEHETIDCGIASRQCKRLAHSPWIWAAVLIALAYAAIPITPMVPVEGDDIGIALGAYAMSLHETCRDDLIYRYDAQPGTYLVTLAIHRLLQIETLTALCLISAIGAGVFIASSAILLNWSTSVPLSLCLAGSFLVPELFVCSYFGNSSSTAAFFLGPALLLSWNSSFLRALAAGVAWGFAIWCRFDAILAGPLLGVLCWRGRTSIMPIGALWCSGLATVTTLTVLSDASFTRLLATFKEHKRYAVDWHHTLGCYSTLLSVTCLAALIVGMSHFIRHKQWKEVATAIAGTLPIAGAYGLSITTPKYFYFGIPSLLIGVLTGLVVTASEFPQQRKSFRRYLAITIAALCVGQYLLPLKTNLAYQYTADGPRLRLAIAATPLLWWREKANASKAYIALTSRLDDAIDGDGDGDGDITIVTNGWVEKNLIPYRLLLAGWQFGGCESRKVGTRHEMTLDDRHLTLIRLNDSNAYNEIPSEWLPSSPRPILCIGRRDTIDLGDLSGRQERKYNDGYPFSVLRCSDDEHAPDSLEHQ